MSRALTNRGRLSRERDGFTLLEVLVALAIAIPALLVLYRQGASALEITGASLAYQEAVARAQSRLDALTNASLQPGDHEGDDGGGFHWRTRVVSVTTAGAIKGSTPRSIYAAGTTLFALSVQVSWPGQGAGSGMENARRVTLETRRIGPAMAEAP